MIQLKWVFLIRFFHEFSNLKENLPFTEHKMYNANANEILDKQFFASLPSASSQPMHFHGCCKASPEPYPDCSHFASGVFYSRLCLQTPALQAFQ